MRCDRCPTTFDPETEPGGLLFGPPERGLCEKLHLCPECYREIRGSIGE